MTQDNKALDNKLCVVLNLLYESKDEFKFIDNQIEDLNLKNNFLYLIKKNEEFAEELIKILKNIDGDKCPGIETILKRDDWKKWYEATHSNSVSLIDEFNQLEILFEKTYREVLNSWFDQNELRDMMRQQLNEIKYIFLKLKLGYLGLK